jgi:hypothetical protein
MGSLSAGNNEVKENKGISIYRIVNSVHLIGAIDVALFKRTRAKSAEAFGDTLRLFRKRLRSGRRSRCCRSEIISL